MAKEHGCEEYLSLVTFGGVTKCYQHLTKDHEKVLEAFSMSNLKQQFLHIMFYI